MEEAKREQLLDQQNISIDVTLPGDNVHFPVLHLIVERYVHDLE